MYKTFLTMLLTVWLLDVFNLPFMQWLDTTVPFNTIAWLITLVVAVLVGLTSDD